MYNPETSFRIIELAESKFKITSNIGLLMYSMQIYLLNALSFSLGLLESKKINKLEWLKLTIQQFKNYMIQLLTAAKWRYLWQILWQLPLHLHELQIRAHTETKPLI